MARNRTIQPDPKPFDFVPKFAWIYSGNNSIYKKALTNWSGGIIPFADFLFGGWTNSYQQWLGFCETTSSDKLYGKLDGNTVYWYHTQGPEGQMNDTSRYHYLAIG